MPDHPLAILCCCGCLPWIALIKIILISPITTIIIFPSCIVISIIMLPHDIVYTYYTVLATKKYGPNLKFLGVLLLWAPLIAWPIMVAIGSLFFGLGLGVYWVCFIIIYRIFNFDISVFRHLMQHLILNII